MKRLVRICYGAETQERGPAPALHGPREGAKGHPGRRDDRQPGQPAARGALHCHPRDVPAGGSLAQGRAAGLAPVRSSSIVSATCHAADIDGKYFLSYEHIHRASAPWRKRIASSGFDPDLIVAIGTGGFIPARILKTFLGIPILTVGISYYGPDNKPGNDAAHDPVDRRGGEEAAGAQGPPRGRGGRFPGHPGVLPAGAAPPRPGRDRRGRAAQQEEGKEGTLSRRRSVAISPGRSWTTSGSAIPGTRGTSPRTKRSPARGSSWADRET